MDAPSGIVVLTPYQDQYIYYGVAITREKEKESGLKLEDILLKKIDRFHGGERFITIVNLTVTN